MARKGLHHQNFVTTPLAAITPHCHALLPLCTEASCTPPSRWPFWHHTSRLVNRECCSSIHTVMGASWLASIAAAPTGRHSLRVQRRVRIRKQSSLNPKL